LEMCPDRLTLRLPADELELVWVDEPDGQRARLGRERSFGARLQRLLARTTCPRGLYRAGPCPNTVGDGLTCLGELLGRLDTAARACVDGDLDATEVLAYVGSESIMFTWCLCQQSANQRLQGVRHGEPSTRYHGWYR